MTHPATHWRVSICSGAVRSATDADQELAAGVGSTAVDRGPCAPAVVIGGGRGSSAQTPGVEP